MTVVISIAVHKASVLGGIFSLVETTAAAGIIDGFNDGFNDDHDVARRSLPFQGGCARAASASRASLSKRRSLRAIHSSC